MRDKLKLPPLLIALLVNNCVYFGSRLLMSGAHHHNLDSLLDAQIPFIPQFIIVYLGCYLFWIFNYILIACSDKEVCFRFFTADFYGRIICLVCFLLFPTTNTRPDLIGNDVWTQLVRFLYSADAANNLFPSIHCMVSWYCCVGLRKCGWIPKWYRALSYALAVTVCISTVCLKQHVLIDVIAGIAAAEITYAVSQRTNGYRVYLHISEWIEKQVRGLLRGRMDQKKNGK